MIRDIPKILSIKLSFSEENSAKLEFVTYLMIAPMVAFVSQGPTYIDSKDILSVSRVELSQDVPLGTDNELRTCFNVSINEPNRHYRGDGKKERRYASVCKVQLYSTSSVFLLKVK